VAGALPYLAEPMVRLIPCSVALTEDEIRTELAELAEKERVYAEIKGGGGDTARISARI
jgi:hypothetical protein